MIDPPKYRLKVFLCHAKEDKLAARALYQRLSTAGWIDPWLDEEKLLPGQDWDMEIEKAVRVTDVVIVCLSSNSVTKEGYIQHEIRLVLRVAGYKPEGVIFIIPIRLNDCAVPMRLELQHYVDFFPFERQEWAYKRLIQALRNRFDQIVRREIEHHKRQEVEDSPRNNVGEQAHEQSKEKAKQAVEARARREGVDNTIGNVEEKAPIKIQDNVRQRTNMREREDVGEGIQPKAEVLTYQQMPADSYRREEKANLSLRDLALLQSGGGFTKFILRWAINAIALYLAVLLLPGIDLQSSLISILWLALIFGLINALVRPLLQFLTCPLIILTLGFFTLVVNTLLFWLTSVIGQSFGFGLIISDPVWWNAFLGGLVVSLVSVLLTMILKDELKGRRRF
jgi:uncharacterized membrane protein YvlD (DUF360 family)